MERDEREIVADLFSLNIPFKIQTVHHTVHVSNGKRVLGAFLADSVFTRRPYSANRLNHHLNKPEKLVTYVLGFIVLSLITELIACN